MKAKRDVPKHKSAGFTLIEILVVVGLIAIITAMSLPSVARFIRNYRIRGAMDQVLAEINQARMTAISKNANPGAAFLIADRNSYRSVLEIPAPGVPVYGPMRDLPVGVEFVPGTDGAFRFTNLGSWCQPGTPTCADATPPACRPQDALQCGDTPGDYITTDATGSMITLVEITTGQRRIISVSPGGRVRTGNQDGTIRSDR